MGSGRSGSPPGTETGGAAVDEAVLRQLLADVGADNLVEICALFVRDAREQSRAIDVALRSGDTDTAGRAAHRLKSAAGFLGASSLSALCAEIERLARRDELDQARARVDELSEEVARTSACMDRAVTHLTDRESGTGGGR